MEKSCQNIAVEQCLIRRLKIKYTLIILSLILGGCGSETSRTLRHADSVMEEHPDSAMTILSSIDRHTLKDSDLPYFALLYTQAQVKTDVPLDSDSLISLAYAKYGDDTGGDLGIRSNFYTGEVFFNQKKYREAMPCYLTAYEESKRLSNDYWHAKAAERIADLLFFAYKYDESAKFSQEAASLFKQVGRQINHRYTLVQLANILLNDGKSKHAYELLDSLYTLASEEKSIDYAFLDFLKMPLIDAKVKIGKVDDMVLNQVSVNEEMSDREKIDVVILDSEVSNINGKPQNVKTTLNDLMCYAHSDEDKIHILYARYENAKAVGDLDLAVSLVDSMLYYLNTVAEYALKESITGAQRDFYSQMAVRNEGKSHFMKWMLVMAVIVFVLLVVVILVFFILKNRARKAELQTQLETLLALKFQSDGKTRQKVSLEEIVQKIGTQSESLFRQIQKLQSINEERNLIIEKLFKEKWTTLDTLCDQYYGLDNSELNAKDIVANMQKELKKIVSKKGLAEIVDAVDIYMGGIVSDLRTQCTFLKEADINFLALLYAGFSVRAVCMFTGIKYDYFYVKKSRLIKRIEASDAPDKSLFLEKLK